MATCLVEVVKVGGSLLERPDLLQTLAAWLGDQEPCVHRVIVVGGGAVVDGLRQLAELLVLDDHAAHWHAIRLMDLTGRAVGAAAPWTSVDSWRQLRTRCETSGTTQFLADDFLRQVEPTLPGTLLPVGWHVTSDSIAARIAVCLAAHRLVLLKSRPATLPERNDWTLAARQGLVDEFFPHLAMAIPRVECQMLPGGLDPKS